MVEKTGCDGVVVGRGCLGRPWLFGELEAAFAGRPAPTPPTLGQVAGVMRRHVELLDRPPRRAQGRPRRRASTCPGTCTGSRWAPEVRRELGLIDGLDRLDELLARLDGDQPFPAEADGPRGRQGSPGHVTLPEGWLDDPEDVTVPDGGRRHALRRLTVRPAAALVVGTVLCAGLAGCASVVPGTATFGPVRDVRPRPRRRLRRRREPGGRGGARSSRRRSCAPPRPRARRSPRTGASASSTLDTSLVGRTLRPDPGLAAARLRRDDRSTRRRGLRGGGRRVGPRRARSEIREDVGSKHFVVRDGRVTSYAPCAN